MNEQACYMMNSTYFVLCSSCFIFIIVYLDPKYLQTNILSKQPKVKAGVHLNYNSNQDEVPQKLDLRKWMNEKENNYQKDKERIKKVCKRYNVEKRNWIDKKYIFVDRYHGIAGCLHAKVGSTTWGYLWRDLLPETIFKQLAKQYKINREDNLRGYGKWIDVMRSYYIPQYNVLGGLSSKTSPYFINNFLRSNQTLTFSFVRHPFERLVSAYKDKFSGKAKEFSRIYSWWFKGEISFSSFVDLVLYEYQKNCYPYNKQSSRTRTNWSNQTCIDNVNNHWQPFEFRCSYCEINYDVIGRMETWNDDLHYIIGKRGLEKVLPLEKVAISHHHASKLSTKEMTKEYFKTLSQEQKESLHHMYRLDFEMFNYDPKIY